MFDLTGKIAIVTGASRGIGRAIATTLAARGATVVAAARGDNAAATVEEITRAGGKAETASVDVTDTASVEALVSGTIERHGRIDRAGQFGGPLLQRRVEGEGPVARQGQPRAARVAGKGCRSGNGCRRHGWQG